MTIIPGSPVDKMNISKLKTGRVGGRPLTFKDKDKLVKRIDEYFKSCYSEDEKGVSKQWKPYTLSGLAVFLKTDRFTLYNYGRREDYFNIIKDAKTKIEENIETGALMNKLNGTVAIFNLKNNFGWVDKQEISQKTVTLDITEEITIEQKEGLARRYNKNNVGL